MDQVWAEARAGIVKKVKIKSVLIVFFNFFPPVFFWLVLYGTGLVECDRADAYFIKKFSKLSP